MRPWRPTPSVPSTAAAIAARACAGTTLTRSHRRELRAFLVRAAGRLPRSVPPNSRATSRRISARRPCSARTAAAGAVCGPRSAACAERDAAHPRVSPEPQVRERSVWGWGWTGFGPDPDQVRGIAAALQTRFGLEPLALEAPPAPAQLELPPPRCTPPPALASLCSTSTRERAAHTYGKSFRDLVRGLRRDFSNPPDVVARPRSEDDVVALLEWCSGLGAAAIPYGGGSSVVGGVEPPPRGAFPAVVSLDLSHLSRVLEVDRVSRAAP